LFLFAAAHSGSGSSALRAAVVPSALGPLLLFAAAHSGSGSSALRAAVVPSALTTAAVWAVPASQVKTTGQQLYVQARSCCPVVFLPRIVTL